jgi:hypothetical protein
MTIPFSCSCSFDCNIIVANRSKFDLSSEKKREVIVPLRDRFACQRGARVNNKCYRHFKVRKDKTQYF